MRIVIVAGGVGGARFLLGVRAAAPDADITAVVNTGDDVTLHGLRICPDLDSVMYTLGDGIDPVRGWGRRDESWVVKDELAAYGAEPTWFGLGDRDLATHLVRTRMLDAGYPLSEVTLALAQRWAPGVTLLPMSDQRVETHVVVTDPGTGRPQAIHFQEWWVRHRAALDAQAFVQVGVDEARPAPGVVEAFASADAVLIARPTRWSRSAPCSASPDCATPCWPPPPASWVCRRWSTAHRCAAWPTAACRRSASR